MAPGTFYLLIAALTGFFFIAMGAGAAQQAGLSDIGNTTVTLYHYENGTRGAIVPMPDNPQRVNWDPSLAAPGMYTFSHVPAGQWYYLEADHDGNKWYAVFYMAENAGTLTRNVHIPPMTPVNASGEAVISPTPTPAASIPAPAEKEGSRATPGMTLVAAVLSMAAMMAIMALKRG